MQQILLAFRKKILLSSECVLCEEKQPHYDGGLIRSVIAMWKNIRLCERWI